MFEVLNYYTTPKLCW